MNIKTIIICLGEPNSIFSEILFKYFSSTKFKKLNKKIVLIGSKNLLTKQMKKLKYNLHLNEISEIHSKKTFKLDLQKFNIKNKKIVNPVFW